MTRDNFYLTIFSVYNYENYKKSLIPIKRNETKSENNSKLIYIKGCKREN